MNNYIIPLELRFHPNEIGELCKSDLSASGIPIVYFRNDEIPYSYKGKKYLSITYYMHYQENYGIGLNGYFPYKKSLGYHPKDIERIRILYDIDTGMPKFVFFSAHAQEGIWVPFNECEMINGKLIIYVAWGSHAHKPHAGVYLRIFGFASDHYSNNGKHITPMLIQDQSLPYLEVLNEQVFSPFLRRFLMPLLIGNSDKYIEDQKKKR